MSTGRPARNSAWSERFCRSPRATAVFHGRSRTSGCADARSSSWHRKTCRTARPVAAGSPRSRADAVIRHRLAVGALPTAAIPFLAACGGGSQNASEPLPTTAPSLTVPGETKTPKVDNSTTTTTTDTSTTTAPTTTPTQTTTAQSNPSTPQGGAAAPQTGGATPNGGQGDTAPPAGSPAGKFEEFCKENPGAC